MLNLSFASNSSASLMNFRHSEMGTFVNSSTKPLNLLARHTHVKRHPVLVVRLPGHVFQDGYCPVDFRSQWLIKKLSSKTSTYSPSGQVLERPPLVEVVQDGLQLQRHELHALPVVLPKQTVVLQTKDGVPDLDIES